jgi:hypothetical protein
MFNFKHCNIICFHIYIHVHIYIYIRNCTNLTTTSLDMMLRSGGESSQQKTWFRLIYYHDLEDVNMVYLSVCLIHLLKRTRRNPDLVFRLLGFHVDDPWYCTPWWGHQNRQLLLDSQLREEETNSGVFSHDPDFEIGLANGWSFRRCVV